MRFALCHISVHLQSNLMKLRKITNFQLTDQDKETILGQTVTVPNEAYTIREIMEKFTHGISPEIEKSPIYGTDDMDYDDEDHSKLLDLDPVDKQDVINRLQTIQDDATAKIDSMAKAAADKKKAAAAKKSKPDGVKPVSGEVDEVASGQNEPAE